MSMLSHQTLTAFLQGINQRIDTAIEAAAFEQTQQALLEQTCRRYRRGVAMNPVTDPLAIFYTIARASGRPLDAQAEHLGSFCTLYILAADLFDDVQDEDLAGKPHAEVGPAIAMNNALALLFLGLDALRQGMALEPDPDRRLAYLELFNRTSLLAIDGQHRDLLGAAAARTPAEVLAMQQAKTSSLALVAECAAIFAHCDAQHIAAYRRAGELLVLLVQIVDDVRDIFGKRFSPDLATGKMTYPLACFLERASPAQRATYEALVQRQPDSIRELRALFYSVGAVEAAAEKLEHLRREFHGAIASTGYAGPEHRNWLNVIDGLVGAIYTPPLLEETRFILQPDGAWDRRVRALAEEFMAHVAPFDPPELPPLLAWHQPQWMYDPKRKLIYYPDLEAQSAELLPAQAALLGLDDLALVQRTLETQAPVVLTHELFHAWRDIAGGLTADSWYEEWAANSLTTAYVKACHPELVAGSLALVERILAAHPDGLGAQSQHLLDQMFAPGYQPQTSPPGYGVDMAEMALIQMHLVRRLYARDCSLDEAMETFLQLGVQRRSPAGGPGVSPGSPR